LFVAPTGLLFVFLHKFLAPRYLLEDRNKDKLYQTERIGTFHFRSRRGEGGWMLTAVFCTSAVQETQVIKTGQRKKVILETEILIRMSEFWMPQICNLSSIKTPWDIRDTYLYFMISLTNYFRYRSFIHQNKNHITEKFPFPL